MSQEKKNPIPSTERQHIPKGETLRERAMRGTHGRGSNPSQLGDPISLKAETSDYIPTEEEEGSINGGDRATHSRSPGSSTKGMGDRLKEAAATMFHSKAAEQNNFDGDVVKQSESGDRVPVSKESSPRKSKL